jgi:hypothetical protein
MIRNDGSLKAAGLRNDPRFRMALCDENHNIVNIITLPEGWTGKEDGDWQVPEGMHLCEQPKEKFNYGDKWDGKVLTRKPIIPTPKTKDQNLIEKLIEKGILSQEEADEIRKEA